MERLPGLVDNGHMLLRSSIARSALFFALCTAESAGQQVGTGSVSGTVKVERTGGPAVGALVTLFPVVPAVARQTLPETGEYVVRDEPRSSGLSGSTDGKGSFAIGGVPPGEYSVTLYKTGYVAQDPRMSAQGTLQPGIHTVRVLPGGSAKVELVLEGGGQIEGKVSFTDGRPAHTGEQGGAEIAVNVEMETAPGVYRRFGGAAHTDANGVYRLEGLPAARYIVFAALPGATVPTSRGRMGTSGRVIFAPSAIRASKAEVVEVRGSGTRSGVDIVISTGGLYAVSGRVVDGAGAPVNEGLIRLYPEGEPELARAVPPGVNGEFRFADLPDERYTVRFESQGTIDFVGLTEDKTGCACFGTKRRLRQSAPRCGSRARMSRRSC